MGSLVLFQPTWKLELPRTQVALEIFLAIVDVVNVLLHASFVTKFCIAMCAFYRFADEMPEGVK